MGRLAAAWRTHSCVPRSHSCERPDVFRNTCVRITPNFAPKSAFTPSCSHEIKNLRTVVAWESGEYQPSQETMGSIESVLDFPSSFFCGEDLDEPSAEIVSFRALTKMKARQRDMALMQGAIAVYFASWLDKRFDLPQSALPDLGYET